MTPPAKKICLPKSANISKPICKVSANILKKSKRPQVYPRITQAIEPDNFLPHQLVFDLRRNHNEIKHSQMSPHITYLTTPIPCIRDLINEALLARDLCLVNEVVTTLRNRRLGHDHTNHYNPITDPHSTTEQLDYGLPEENRISVITKKVYNNSNPTDYTSDSDST